MQVSQSPRFAVRLLLGASLLAVASPVFAQEAEEDTGLGEIVVTAQKREQNLQDVPIAISAIGSEKLERLNVRDTRDLSGLAPNVTIVQGTTSNSAAVISIRGITSPASESFGLDQANALYVDGIYIGRSGASALDVMDIERVEVLRGPQGTLFGRNSTGGAIAFISRDPSDELKVSARGGFGNYGAWNGRVSLDTGEVLGGLKATLSYSHSRRNGTVDNILQPDNSKDPGARRTDALRAALKLDLGETGSIRYIFDWSKTTGRNVAFQLTNVADGTARPPLVVNGQPGITQTQQAPVQQYLAGATFLDARCAALAAPTRVYRDTICLDQDKDAIDEIQGHNLQLQNDFGGFQVKMTAGYRKWDSTSLSSDLDGLGTFRGSLFSNATLFNGMPAALLAFIPTIPSAARPFIAASPVPTTTQGLFDTNNVRNHQQFSQEIEVSGDSEVLDWVVGGFYFWEKGSENNPQNSGFVLDTNQIFLANFGGLGPSFVAANPARYRLVVTNGLLRYTTSSESTALYGQATYYVGGRDGQLSLTGGLRYTWDNKFIIRQQSGATAPATPDQGRASFGRLTWNAMARYEFTDEVSMYLRAASGYRSGGFNAPDTTQAGTSTLLPFESETIVSYEAGIKAELLDRRLRVNLAGYHNKFKNLAANIPVVTSTPGVFGSRIVNVGKVDYTGFEVEARAVINDYLSIDGTFGYVDVNYKEFKVPTSGAVGAPIVDIASIAREGYTSRYTGNIAANLRVPLSDNGMTFNARVGYTYESPKYSFSNTISTPFNEQLKSDPKKQIDAQVSIDGIQIGGGEAQLLVWGKNLTNRHEFARGIDFGALGYAGGYFADPRTYGVTLGVKF
ncbi:TonB-dependent receptor [Novosphingobium sp.]|jgi:iron complex outermembrane receptor protein|uniref:TonB-dependent receptor n=1 Tax=Novosphingobium sp. TaxID=1874826 RepID=UPI0022C8E6E1|nr:TonB-dependent receptor [Novosphingobium sp.]MCZ8018426.1 TonB-dependent receptor [Novosphingobium sp.]MCZ8033420.1 TonB-dependent receptor [Novosphingobium sp.]MCZ8051875.1 TonB-dependent receptor [Novosphingobium sp.]MCZ8060417.1 TonB-dependent receptor [Novosphingobium sp.]MCZ8232059.1 TonB-dependent receptor [Novosphingobium sp.]